MMVVQLKSSGGTMKTILLLITLMSSSAFATTLKIPFFIEDNNQLISVSQINKQYNLKGADKLQEVLVITNTKRSIQEARDAYWVLYSKVETLAEKVQKNFFLAGDHPGGFKINDVKTCYTGSPDEAVEIAANMSDSIYSDQLGIFGYKFKNKITYLEGFDQDEMADFLNTQSATWKNWKSTNDDILVLSHETDSGDDVNEGIIIKCK